MTLVRRMIIAIVAVVSALAAGAMPSPTAARAAHLSAVSLPPTGRMLQLFAPLYMAVPLSPAYTESEAVTIAEGYDLIVANAKQLSATTIAAMKAANPTVRILVYLNGSFDLDSVQQYPLSEYARDANGNFITSVKYHNWLMDVGNPAWADQVSQECTNALSIAPWDGCFIDMLGDALLGNSYLSGEPINPATGQPWTAQERMDATTAIASAVTAAHPNNIVMANGLNDGPSFYSATAPSSELLSGVNTALAETWLRQATLKPTRYRGVVAWQQEVNMLAQVGSMGDSIAVTTKLWTTATAAQVEAWHQYALASFLLGTSGSAYFSFTVSQSPMEWVNDATNPLDHMPVGPALAPYQAQGNAFIRQYADAEVMVNPTKKSVTIPVTMPCTTLEGTAITTSITLPATSGDICTHAAIPVVTGVAPNAGPAAGGTSVTITGSGFTGATQVDFGSANAASSFTFDSDGQISATSPPGAGTVDVTVTTPGGTSALSAADQFVYSPLPVVSGVSPDTGPIAGGTLVTITGSGFTGATEVDFGAGNAASFTFDTDGQITATSPAGSGTVDISVITPGGTSTASVADQFTYQ